MTTLMGGVSSWCPGWSAGLHFSKGLEGSWNRDLYPERKCFVQVSAPLYQRVAPLSLPSACCFSLRHLAAACSILWGVI